MSKSLYSRHNQVFLKKLRELRESRQLRQADLGELLGRSQGWVSYVESGATTLNVIELRQWVEALDYSFMEFLRELDDELRGLGAVGIRGPVRKGSTVAAARARLASTK